MSLLTQILSELVLGEQLFKLLSVGVAIAASGCHSLGKISTIPSLTSQSKPSAQAPTMSKSVKFQILDVAYSPLEEGFQPKPKVLVFRNKQVWTEFWASSSLLDINLQKRPAPEVNFDNQIVIALTLGSKPTGGFSVRIERIDQVENPQGNKWVLHYTETIPAQNCIVTQQPTTPAVFVLTEKSDIPVELQGHQIIFPCSN